MGAPSNLIVDDICRAIFDLRAEIVVRRYRKNQGELRHA
jgi:hypothetical protein